MPRLTLRVPMRMQGRNDCYCGLRCLSTAARHLGLSGQEQSAWRATIDNKLGVGRRMLVELAGAMGMTVTRGSRWRPRDISDARPDSIWLARIHCSLPSMTSRTGRWTGAHYVLLLAVRPSSVTIGDPFPQKGLDPVRDVPRASFLREWRRASNWAVELRRA